MKILSLSLLVFIFCFQTHCHNILDFGAIPGSEENTTKAFINSWAMTQTIIAANESLADRTVVIPDN